jgi:hypothetical protein
MSKQTQDHIVDVNKKETAIEWFFEQIMYADLDIKVWEEIFEQAKEIEKQQLIDFSENYLFYDGDSEEQYNETFKD